MSVALEGIANLFTLLAWFITLSLLYIWRFTVGAFIEHLANLLDKAAVHVLGRTIHFLGPVSAGLRDVDAAIQTTLAEIARYSEHATVFLFHKTLAALEMTGRELWSIGYDVGGALERIVHRTIPAQVRALTNTTLYELRHLRERIATTEHALTRPLVAAVHRLEATVAHDFGLARHGIDVTRKDVREATRELGRLGARVRTLEKELGAAALTAAVAVALSRLGLRWLRCPSLGRAGRSVGCKGFASLERLIAGALELAAAGLAYFSVVDPVTIAREAVKAEDAMESLIRRLAD